MSVSPITLFFDVPLWETRDLIDADAPCRTGRRVEVDPRRCGSQMTDPAKETVIIVHGTWAAPKSAKAQWYQPIDGGGAAEGFVSKLNTALQERDSPARCWAHCANGNPIFQWSGENDWIARTHAASALADYVAKLQNEGWYCHIVAHSHGGNVVVEALPQILDFL